MRLADLLVVNYPDFKLVTNGFKNDTGLLYVPGLPYGIVTHTTSMTKPAANYFHTLALTHDRQQYFFVLPCGCDKCLEGWKKEKFAPLVAACCETDVEHLLYCRYQKHTMGLSDMERFHALVGLYPIYKPRHFHYSIHEDKGLDEDARSTLRRLRITSFLRRSDKDYASSHKYLGEVSEVDRGLENNVHRLAARRKSGRHTLDLYDNLSHRRS